MSTWAGLVKKDYGSSKGFWEDTKVCVCVSVCVCLSVYVTPCAGEREMKKQNIREISCAFSFGSFFDILSEAKI